MFGLRECALHRKGRAPRQHNACGTVLTMQVVHVHVQVKPESMEAFRQATLENARNSVREPGIARFDVIQDVSNPSHFVLVEVYRNSDALAEHKATAHYQKWRDAVADMMAAPRTSAQFGSVFPDDEGW